MKEDQRERQGKRESMIEKETERKKRAKQTENGIKIDGERRQTIQGTAKRDGKRRWKNSGKKTKKDSEKKWET